MTHILVSSKGGNMKTRMLSMLGTGYFLKSQKLIPNKKNQSVLIVKLVPTKHKKSPIRKNKLPQKFRSTRYLEK